MPPFTEAELTRTDEYCASPDGHFFLDHISKSVHGRPTMTDNEQLPAKAIEPFIQHALSVGAYQTAQAANHSAALKLVLEHARKTNAKVYDLPAGALLKQVDSILDDYGGQTNVSAQSIITYKWRAKKAVTDFIERNGGDFMAWKTELARKGKSAATKANKKPKAKQLEKETTPPPADPAPAKPLDAQPGEQSQRLKLPGGKVGRLILPDPITKKEIDAAWKLLDAYKIWLEAEAAAIDDETPDDGAQED